MKSLSFAVTIGLFLVPLVNAQVPNIDLSGWTEIDYTSDNSAGDWAVAPDGASLLQQINGYPTYYVSDFQLLNESFSGALGVETSSDDDFIGFVFGFSAAPGPSDDNPNTYYLLQWKMTDQTIDSGAFGPEGIRLLKVQNTAGNDSATMQNALWGSSDSFLTVGGSIEILASLDGTQYGWTPFQAYSFTLVYLQDGTGQADIQIRIFDTQNTEPTSDDVLFAQLDATDPAGLGSGLVGFYNSSQSDVTYAGFVLSDCNGNDIHDAEDISNGTSSDCNGNSIPDECEAECGSNGIPDDCEPDCNSNSTPDDCDINDGTSTDCTGNGIPDECEPDCNGNLIADSCDLQSGTSSDCNNNGEPDECELAAGTAFDCNGNGVLDQCDITAGTSDDCNANDIPDDCEMGSPPAHNCCDDTHGAGCSDAAIETCVCDVDPFCCNGEWDSDCVAAVDSIGCSTCNITGDCNGNGVLDDCDITAGTSSDCNNNGEPDECELTAGTAFDCNGNSVLDSCDITAGTSDDCDGLGVPDECEVSATTGIRLSQESAPGVGDFDSNVLGFVTPFQSTLTASDYFRYNLGNASSFNGPMPQLVNERSHLFLVQNTDGLSLMVVHDRPGNADGGSAATRYEFTGDPDGLVRTVEDDSGESYTGAPGSSVFTVNHAWATCCTDGIALTGLDGTWTATMEITGNLSGMNSWVYYSNTGDELPLVLAVGRRVQLEVVFDPSPADCNGNGVPDLCDLDDGTSEDCNNNGTPDECEVPPIGTGDDCNADGIPDDCQLTDNDCNGNNTPDDCEIANAAPSTETLIDLDFDSGVDSLGAAQGVLFFQGAFGFSVAFTDDESDGPEGGNADGAHISNLDYGNIKDGTTDLVLGAYNSFVGPDNYHTSGIVAQFARGVELVRLEDTDDDTTPKSLFAYDENGQVIAETAPGSQQTFQVDTSMTGGALIFGVEFDTEAGPAGGASDGTYFTIDNFYVESTVTLGSDCNVNGVPDECEADCNVNGVADECDISTGTSDDCNNNDIPDACDVATGGALDCNGNNVPDVCEPDCNGNSIPDECDITDGTSVDCNINGVPDSCDLSAGTSQDCNNNSTPDDCDISSGTSLDCNSDEVPDECQADCNNNGTPDDCDLAAGTSFDCNGNSVPDECDIDSGSSQDCNGNLLPDECDIADMTSDDCNGNGMPDECELAAADCNNNGKLDGCDIADGASQDCNGNLLPDECDLSSGTSQDCNGNLIPDECDVSKSIRARGLTSGNETSAVFILPHAGSDSNFYGGTEAGDFGDYVGIPPIEKADLLDDTAHLFFVDTSGGLRFFVVYEGNDSGAVLTVDALLHSNATEFTIEDLSVLDGTPDTYSIVAGDISTQHQIGTAGAADGYVAVVDDALSSIGDRLTLTLTSPVTDTGVTSMVVYAGSTLGAPDWFELESGDFSAGVTVELEVFDDGSDCNNNDIPDICELNDGTSFDCNGNNVIDECDIADGTSEDCNDNNIPDQCDLLDGTSEDCNSNDTPDECEVGDLTDVIAAYNLDGNADDLLGQHDGTLSGDAAFAAGIINEGLTVDGDGDYVRLGNVHANPARSLSEGTVEMWFKLTEPQSGKFVLLGAGTEYGSEFDDGVYLGRHDNYGNTLMFGIWPNGWQWAISSVDPDSLVGEWHHAAGTWGPNGVELWLDFQLVATNPTTAAPSNPNYETVLIGSDSWRWDSAAVIDQVRIYDRQIVPSAALGLDCNANGVPDECDVTDGTSNDCNADGIPDECQADCNGNNVPDDCDLTAGTSQDCNSDTIPDECQTDCNSNGTPDDCDLTAGTSLDCNLNDVPDECDIASASSEDCNMNDVPDECDLSSGTSNDNNGNNTPDECEAPPVVDSVTPSGVTYQPVSQLDIAFSTSIDAATFTVDDILFTDPDGLPITVDPPQDLGDNLFRITFTEQSAEGTYLLTIGPDISSLAGKLMEAAYDTSICVTLADRGFSTVDFSASHNARLQGLDAGYPEGDVTLGGVPFNIPVGGNNYWHSNSATGSNPRTLDIPVNIDDVQEVHTLINSYWGQSGPSSYAWLEFFGDQGAYYRYDLIGNDDIRDYNGNTWTNSINGTTTTEVVSLGSHRLDKQQIALPVDFHDQRLTTMRLSDDGDTNFQRTFLAGVTVFGRGGNGNLPLRVADLQPAVTTTSPLSEATVTFSRNLDGTTLTLDDVIVVGPTGPVDVTGVSALDGKTYLIMFDPQSVDGEYLLRIAATVADHCGLRLDEDADGIDGETVDDAFEGTLVLNSVPPSVVSQAPVGVVNAALSSIEVTFNEIVAAGTVSTADFSLSGPAGGVGINTVTQQNAFTYRVSFATQTALGDYTLQVGPAITDLAGSAMVAPYAGVVTVSLPDISADLVTGPTSSITGDSITLDWMTSNVGNFDALGIWTDRVYLSDDLAVGGDIALGSVTQSGPLAMGNSYNRSESFSVPASALGMYYLLVISNADGDVVEVGAANNAAFSVDQIMILDGTPPDTNIVGGPAEGAPVNTSTVIFDWTGSDNATDPANLLFSYCLASAGGNCDPTAGPFTADVQATFNGLSEAGSPYTFRVAAQDEAGLADASPASRSFGLDTTPLQVVGHSPDGAVNNAVDRFSITFTEPAFGFGTGDVSLTGPNGAISINAVGSNGDGTEWTVFFASQTTPGSYSFSVGPNLTDAAGNSLPSAYAGGFSISLPNLVVTSLTTPTTGESATQITVSWTVENQGQADAFGSWRDRVYLSTDDTFGADTLLAEFTTDGPLAQSDSYSRTQAIPLPALIEGTFWIFVQTDAAGDLAETSEGADNRRRSDATIDVSLFPYPDLTVANVINPSTAFAGRDVTICWEVSNDAPGETGATAWLDALYLSTDESIGAGDTLLGRFSNPASLASQEGYIQCQTVTLPNDLVGCFNFIVRADSLNDLFEYRNDLNAEGNNDGGTADCTDVSLAPPPDLRVASVDAPQFGLSGMDITVSWTVENAGNSPTPTDFWRDSIFVSADEQLDAGDQRLCTVNHTGALNPSETYDSTATCALPRFLEGNKYIFVLTDSSNHIPELGLEGNNSRNDPSPTAVMLTPPPDLEVSDIAVFAARDVQTTVTVNWTVTNFGASATESGMWADAVYVSTDDSLGTTGDNVLVSGPHPHEGDLAPDEFYAQSFVVDLPACLDGTQHVFVVTDVNNDVDEYFIFAEENNDDTFQAIPLVTDASDLLVQHVSGDPTGSSGQTVTVSWDLTNIGEDIAPAGSFVDRVYVSADETFDSEQDTPVGDFTNATDLAINDTVMRSEQVTLPIGISGPYYLFVQSNADATLQECGADANNVAYDAGGIFVAFTEADLVVSGSTVPSIGLSGQDLNLSWTVQNGGNRDTDATAWLDAVFFSTNASLDREDDEQLGTVAHSGALPIGDAYGASTTVTLPAGVSGTNYLFICTDENEEVVEPGAEENNCSTAIAINVAATEPDLVVTAVTGPASGTSGDQVTITWTVENLGERTTDQTQWTDEIWVSATPSITGGAVRLARVTHNGVLPFGGSYTASRTPALSAPGTGVHYVLVRTDAFDEVEEGGREGNNTNYDPQTVNVDCTEADLFVTTADAPTVGEAGFPVTISWTVENQGSRRTSTSYWIDRVYISDDPSLDTGSDTLLGEFSRNAYLQVSETYSRSKTLNLPNGIEGAHYLFVQTDAQDRVRECAFENNNVLSPPLVITVGATEVDLEVATINAPSTALAGQPYTVDWQVINNGASGTPNNTWRDSVYLSLDLFFDPNVDPFLGFVGRNEPLGPGLSYDQIGTFTIPGDILPGQYNVLVVADSSDDVFEFNAEDNNLGSAGNTVDVGEPLQSDLVVTDIVTPITASPGLTAGFSWTVTNQGANAALGTWSDSIYLSTDQTWDLSDVLVAKVPHSGTVAANGGTYTSSVTTVIPGVFPVPQYLIVRADVKNQIPEGEAGEQNNQAASIDTIDIEIIELTLGEAFAASLPANNTAQYYKVDVNANETLRITLDSSSASGSNELFVRYGAIPSRGQFDDAHDNPFLPDQEVGVPTTQAGTYYILVYGDYVPTAPQDYTILVEALPFSVTEAFPDQVGNSASVTIAISGARFEEETDFSVVTSDDTTIEPNTIYPLSPSQAYATFDMSGAATGLANIDAEQPDGLMTTGVELLEVFPGGGPNLLGRIIAPSRVRPRQSFPVRIEYANIGNTDMPAPLLELASSEAVEIAFDVDGPYDEVGAVQFLGINRNGPTGILTPGEFGVITIYMRTPNGLGNRFLNLGLKRWTGGGLTDWERESQFFDNPGLGTPQFNAIVDRMIERVGDTYGELEQRLANLATRLWQNGETVLQVRELFAHEIDFAADFYPSTIAGTIVDADTGALLPNVKVIARYDEEDDGTAEFLTHTFSDADGMFELRVEAGLYGIYAEGYYFDPLVNVPIGAEEDVLGLMLEAIPVPAPEPFVPDPLPEIPDLGPSLAFDRDGDLHMVWSRDQEVWHATWDGADWAVSGAVTDASGLDPQVTEGPPSEPGDHVTVLWQTGDGNESDLDAAIGRPDAANAGLFEWTNHIPIVDDNLSDQAGEFIFDNNGDLIVVWLKHDDALLEEDTDLYYDAITLAPPAWPGSGGRSNELRGPARLVSDPDLILSDPDYLFSGKSTRQQFGPFAGSDSFDPFRGGGGVSQEICLGSSLSNKSVLHVPIIGGSYGFEISWEFCGSRGCDLSISGQVSGKTELGRRLKGSISGGGSAKWKTSQEDCTYEFDSAKLSFNGGASARFPVDTIPIGRIVSIASRLFAIKWELGIQVGGSLGGEIKWEGGNFPGWPTGGNGTWSVNGGPYGEISLTDSIKGSITGVLNVQGEWTVVPLSVSLTGVCVQIKAEASAWWVTYKFTYEYPEHCGGGRADPLFDLPDHAIVLRSSGITRGLDPEGLPDFTELIIVAEPPTGSPNVYPGQTVLQSVANDLFDDSRASLAKDSLGTVTAVWSKDADPTQSIGVAVVASEFTGSGWTAPVELAPATAFNGSPKVVFDSNDDAMAVWPSALTDSLTLSSTTQEFLDAIDATDLMFARRQSGVWSAPVALAGLSGSDDDVTLAAGPSGEVLAAWIHGDVVTEQAVVYTSMWDGTSWGAPQAVASSARVVSVECSFTPNGTPMVVWSTDPDGNLEDTPNDLTLYTSVFNTGWTAPIAMPKPDPNAEEGGSRSVGPVELVGQRSTRGFFSPPEECCECTPENQAVKCDDGFSCTEDVCIDYKCQNNPMDDVCQNDLFCDGEETCDPEAPNATAGTGCVPGEDPCSDEEICREFGDGLGACVECASDEDCRDRDPDAVNECTDWRCNFDAGGVCELKTFDSFCDDGNNCTDDTCDENEGCKNESICDDDDECTIDNCDPDTLECSYEDVDCDDNDACTTDTCDPVEGCQHENVCDDNDACTIDHCDSDTQDCSYEDVDCDDNNPCTTDSCDPVEGCQHENVCDDNDACTIDNCDPADQSCSHETVDCDDHNECTTDTCDPMMGCQYEAMDCNDNNVCTTDSCDPQSGCKNESIDCGEGDSCTAVSCDPTEGCKSESLDCDPGPQNVVSHDPNEKIGPSGFGAEGWVGADEPMFYIIRFENLPEAEAPAQTVTVKDQLSPALDWRTFRIRDVGFDQSLVETDGTQGFLLTTVDLTEEKGLIVEITGSINVQTGVATWILKAIDPATGELPADADAGFLPPNNPEVHDGEGFVSFTIRPSRDAETGTVIKNDATIVFDINEPIDTNEVENTLDADPPESQVDALPGELPLTFDIAWTGEDVEGGSGIASYDVYVSENGGPFALLLNTEDTSVSYTAPANLIDVAFYTLARDNAGNVESPPFFPDTATFVVDDTAATVESNSPLCEGETIELTGYPQNGPAGPFTYSWTGPDGFTSDQASPTITDAAPAMAGTYALTVTNAAEEELAPASVDVFVQPAPTAGAGMNQTACVLDTILLAGSVTNAGSWQWSTSGDGIFSDRNDLQATYTPGAGDVQAGSVELTLTATGMGECEAVGASASMTVIVLPCMIVDIDIPGLNGGAVTRDVTFTMTECGGAVDARTLPVSFSPNGLVGSGSIRLDNVPLGATWLAVQGSHTLRSLVAMDVSSGTDSISVSLTPGDFASPAVSQDNVIDVTDFSIMSATFESPVDPNSGIGADVTGDGYIDSADFAVIQPHFFKIGDALDDCPAGGRTAENAEAGSGSGDASQPQAIVPLTDLPPGIRAGADHNADGKVDQQDIRAFLHYHGILISEAFDRKLRTQIENSADENAITPAALDRLGRP